MYTISTRLKDCRISTSILQVHIYICKEDVNVWSTRVNSQVIYYLSLLPQQMTTPFQMDSSTNTEPDCPGKNMQRPGLMWNRPTFWSKSLAWWPDRPDVWTSLMPRPAWPDLSLGLGLFGPENQLKMPEKSGLKAWLSGLQLEFHY